MQCVLHCTAQMHCTAQISFDRLNSTLLHIFHAANRVLFHSYFVSFNIVMICSNANFRIDAEIKLFIFISLIGGLAQLISHTSFVSFFFLLFRFFSFVRFLRRRLLLTLFTAHSI